MTTEKAGAVEYDDDDLPRSFVLVSEGKKCKLRLSRISSKGLLARANEEAEDK